MSGLRFILIAAAAAWSLAAHASWPISGDWQITGSDATLRFSESPGSAGHFDIIWLDGPELSIAPGTVIGHAEATPSPGVYDCSVATDPRGTSDKSRYARFVVKLDAETADSFTFAPYRQGMKFSVQALLPYWWRRSLRQVDTRPGGLDGARRVGAPKPYVEL